MTQSIPRTDPRKRAFYRHFATISTRWGDNDAYGHINNTVYYAWCDSAVTAWLVGQGLLDIASGDPIGLVVETGCRYFAPLSFPGEVEVGMTVERVGNSSVTYLLGVFAHGSETPAAEAHFTHVYVGRDRRRPVTLPDNWVEKLALLSPRL